MAGQTLLRSHQVRQPHSANYSNKGCGLSMLGKVVQTYFSQVFATIYLGFLFQPISRGLVTTTVPCIEVGLTFGCGLTITTPCGYRLPCELPSMGYRWGSSFPHAPLNNMMLCTAEKIISKKPESPCNECQTAWWESGFLAWIPLCGTTDAHRSEPRFLQATHRGDTDAFIQTYTHTHTSVCIHGYAHIDMQEVTRTLTVYARVPCSHKHCSAT